MHYELHLAKRINKLFYRNSCDIVFENKKPRYILKLLKEGKNKDAIELENTIKISCILS